MNPGESLTVTADQEHLYYEAEEPGKYEFQAVYSPPYVAAIDQQPLRGSGIDFPSGDLRSEQLTFTKR